MNWFFQEGFLERINLNSCVLLLAHGDERHLDKRPLNEGHMANSQEAAIPRYQSLAQCSLPASQFNALFYLKNRSPIHPQPIQTLYDLKSPRLAFSVEDNIRTLNIYR